MKHTYLFLFVIVFFTAVLHTESIAQETITTWNFENGSTPSSGAGSLAVIGTARTETGKTGIQPGIALPAGFEETEEIRSGAGLHTYNYPAQGTGAKTTGIHLSVSTVGFKNILFSADVRQSGTSANKLMLQYTIDGVNWERAITYTTDDNDTWYLRNFNFGNIPGVNNNPLFAVRFVTNFDDDVINSKVYVPVSGSKNYEPTGTIRFDNIILRGDKLAVEEDVRTNIAYWSFDNKTLAAEIGTGQVQLLGGISYDTDWSKSGILLNQTIFDQGVYDYAAIKDGYGLQTFNYPYSGVNSKTAGIHLDVNTLDYKNIHLTADVRHGGTSANKVVLQYTVNGSTWLDAVTFTSNSGDTWYKRSYDFSEIQEVDNNSKFAVRFVTAFDGINYKATGFEKIYATTGPIRFDNIRFSGRLLTGLNDVQPEQYTFTIQQRELVFNTLINSNVSIYSIAGSQVYSQFTASSINLSSLDKGIYILVTDNFRAKFILH